MTTPNLIHQLRARVPDLLQGKTSVTHSKDRQWRSFAGNERFTIHVKGSNASGTYAILEGILDPQSGQPLHVHMNEDEVFEILEGTLRFVSDGEVFDADAGDTVHIPRGTVHTWKNVSDKPARVLVIFSPGRISSMFEEFVGKRVDELEHVARHYGTFFVGPPLADAKVDRAESSQDYGNP